CFTSRFAADQADVIVTRNAGNRRFGFPAAETCFLRLFIEKPMSLIDFRSVSKSFARHAGRMLVRDRVTHWLKGSHRERFFALKNISFRVKEGEGLAVIGANGAGKSTLLGLVAGLAQPDEGTVRVNGRIAALLELGSGFHPDLTGAENVRVNAALIGLSRRRTSELFDEIVDFSGIGEFIEEP